MKRITLIVAILFLCILYVNSYTIVTIPKEKHVIELNTFEREFLITATMYHPVKEQCDDTPLLTASGLIINPYTVSNDNYIAISRDLHIRYGGFLRFYDTVCITNAGHKSNKKYIVVDLMNERWKLKIDFLESYNTSIYKYDSVKMKI